jgi:hypothetical protein
MLIQAELVKRATADGLVEFEDDIPLGRVYLVEVDSHQVLMLLNDETGDCHMKEVIYTDEGVWLPVECLKLVVN